jgi:hypothetical protein
MKRIKNGADLRKLDRGSGELSAARRARERCDPRHCRHCDAGVA